MINLKKLISFFLYLSFLSFPLFSLNDSQTLYQIQQYLKKKDYINATKIAESYIKSLEEIQQNDKIIKIYFRLESDLNKLDILLDSIYKDTDKFNKRFHSLLFIFIEKSLLAGEYSLGVKWGEVYKKEAKSKKKKYYKGLYLYACHLYKRNEKNLAMQMIEFALKEKPKKNLKDKLTLLKLLQYNNDLQFSIESKKILKNNPDSNYADFIFANLIQNYKNQNKKEKLVELKEEFYIEHRDSILYDRVKNL